MSSNPKQILAHSFLHSPKGHLNTHFIEGDPKAKLLRGEGYGYVQKCWPSSVLGLSRRARAPPVRFIAHGSCRQVCGYLPVGGRWSSTSTKAGVLRLKVKWLGCPSWGRWAGRAGGALGAQRRGKGILDRGKGMSHTWVMSELEDWQVGGCGEVCSRRPGPGVWLGQMLSPRCCLEAFAATSWIHSVLQL